MKDRDEVIIIVGAGAAGLFAAKRLSKRHHVIVLEASEGIGGRVRTLTIPGFSKPVEAGAEFIHGKLPLTLKLLKRGNIECDEVAGKFYRADRSGFHEQQEMIEGWNQLLKQMKKEKNDMTLQEFMQLHYTADKYSEFREQIKNFAEGFDVADISKASMKALYDEWSHGNQETYRISGGHGRLISYLAGACKENGAEIITNSVVTQINWKKNKVWVHTKDGRQYEGAKCIVTIPLPFLNKTNNSSLLINPQIGEYRDAAGEIGYSTVIKVVIEFNEPFWNSYADNISFLLTDQQIPTWWTQLPDTTPILTGWKGGPGALALSGKSDDEIFNLALEGLSVIFKMPVGAIKDMIVGSKVFNWSTEVFSQGAYSYEYPSSKSAKKLLNTAISDTIYFAGEAIEIKGSPGTVEAALASGRKTAARVRKTL